MAHTRFAVSRFKVRNGVASWCLSGWLGGLRIRRNFKTREEAGAERDSLELKSLQASAGFRSAVTLLSDDQLREAEAVFRRIAGRRQKLSCYVDFALENYREPDCEMTVPDAVARYVEAREADIARDLLSRSSLAQFKWELDALKKRYPKLTVAQLQAAQLKAHFERNAPSLKSYNNRRGLVGTFMKFAFQQNWIVANPVDRMPHFRIAHRRGSATTGTIHGAVC
jgi:hypothetical protein